MTSRPEKAIVLWDSDCGFCRWSLDKVLAWDRHDRLRPVALQDAEAKRLLADLSDEERMASWHLVTPAGERFSAGEAVPPLLALLPGGRGPARLAALLQPATNAAYRLVAGNRTFFGRLTRSRKSDA